MAAVVVPQLHRITGLAWISYSVPHLIYNAHRIRLLTPINQMLNLAALAAAVALAFAPRQLQHDPHAAEQHREAAR